MALQIANVSHNFIRRLAMEYITPDRVGNVMTMKKLALRYNTSAPTISNILFRGVSEGIIDEITSLEIARKAIASTDNTRATRSRWEKAMALRDVEKIEEEIEYLKRALSEVCFQLETYDDFFMDEADAPSKENLKSKKATIQRKITKLQERIKTLKG